MVGRYPTNYLIQRGPIQRRNSFPRRAYTVLAVISNCCSVPLGMFPRVTHPSAAISEEIARLACVRPTASVRSEPGSNSQVERSFTAIPSCDCMMASDLTLTRNDPAHVCVPTFIEIRPKPSSSVGDTCADLLSNVRPDRPHIPSFIQQFQRTSPRRSIQRRRNCCLPAAGERGSREIPKIPQQLFCLFGRFFPVVFNRHIFHRVTGRTFCFLGQ